MPKSEGRRERIARLIADTDSDVAAYEVPPEMFAMLQDLARESGQPIEGVLNRAIGLYKASLDAYLKGKHVGFAESADSLETEFVGLTPSGAR